MARITPSKQYYEGYAKNARGRWPLLHLTESANPKDGTLCGRDFGPRGIEPCKVKPAQMLRSRGSAHCRECVDFARTGSRKGPQGLSDLMSL